MLTRDNLRSLAAKPVQEVAAFGGVVGMRPMTAQQFGALEKRFGTGAAERDPMAYRLALLAVTLCTPEGNPLFADEKECVAVIGQLDKPAVVEAFEAAQRINSMLPEQRKEREGN